MPPINLTPASAYKADIGCLHGIFIIQVDVSTEVDEVTFTADYMAQSNFNFKLLRPSYEEDETEIVDPAFSSASRLALKISNALLSSSQEPRKPPMIKIKYNPRLIFRLKEAGG